MTLNPTPLYFLSTFLLNFSSPLEFYTKQKRHSIIRSGAHREIVPVVRVLISLRISSCSSFKNSRISSINFDSPAESFWFSICLSTSPAYLTRSLVLKSGRDIAISFCLFHHNNNTFIYNMQIYQSEDSIPLERVSLKAKLPHAGRDSGLGSRGCTCSLLFPAFIKFLTNALIVS